MNAIASLFKQYQPTFKAWESLNGLSTQLQNATINEIVFYRLKNDEKSHQLFEQRILQTKAGLIVLDGQPRIQDQRFVLVPAADFIKLQQLLMDIIYPIDSSLPALIGVTGTNGKSTVVHLTTQLLDQCGVKVLSLGTLGLCNAQGEILEDFSMTTPSEVELRKVLHKYRHQDVLCLEVSSHALSQNRLGPLNLKYSGWTSFSQDHLDYHGSMEEYLAAKRQIISVTAIKKVFIPRAEAELQRHLATSEFELADTLTEMNIQKFSPLLTLGFNLSNLELALTLASRYLGESVLPKINPASINLPKGRLNGIAYKKGWVIIDYAHTPDALERVCHQLKAHYPTYHLTVVFGCGGNRDRLKRPLMRVAVEKNADEIIVTSDNPRDEVPQDIIDDIMRGANTQTRIHPIVDRTLAIEAALAKSPEHGIILIAGKGHETYQEIKGIKHPFDDFAVVKKIMSSL